MRILIADQDSEYRQKIANTVQGWGHTVQEALNGREVVEHCRKKCPDLVLMEAHLSGEAGLEIVRQIRQTGGHALWVPIVLLSTGFSDLKIVESVEAGVDDILQKPFNEARLRLKVYSANRLCNLKEEVFKVAHELVMGNRALQQSITQDVLTGLTNASSFEEILSREWRAAQRANTPISLVLLNVDYFQVYNQVYGAEAGDQAIKKVAEALKHALPAGEHFLGRMIGDSFAVVLTKVSREEAFKIAENLKQAIDCLEIPHKNSGASDHITISFGIATAETGHFTNVADLKDNADFALYQAKHRGRNRGFAAP